MMCPEPGQNHAENRPEGKLWVFSTGLGVQHRLSATNKDAGSLLNNSSKSKACISDVWASNCENHFKQVIENSPYLLVDIIVPAEVSWPPWKDMDMNMLEVWKQIMVIAKIVTFFSRLSALSSTRTSNRIEVHRIPHVP